MFNDNLILDCCMYFSRGRQTFLCSSDNNLCITSQSQGGRLLYFQEMQSVFKYIVAVLSLRDPHCNTFPILEQSGTCVQHVRR